MYSPSLNSYEYIPESTKKYLKSILRDDVKSILRDELFWRDILNKLQIDAQVLTSLRLQLPREIESLLPSLLRTQLDSVLPNSVRQQIEFQMPLYLQNNSSFQNILNTHSQRLNTELETKATNILDKLVKDDKYNEITKAHLKSITNKSDDVFKNIESRSQTQYDVMNNKVNTAIEKIQNLYKQDIAKLQDEVKSCNRTINVISFTLVSSVVISGACGLIYMFKS